MAANGVVSTTGDVLVNSDTVATGSMSGQAPGNPVGSDIVASKLMAVLNGIGQPAASIGAPNARRYRSEVNLQGTSGETVVINGFAPSDIRDISISNTFTSSYDVATNMTTTIITGTNTAQFRAVSSNDPWQDFTHSYSISSVVLGGLGGNCPTISPVGSQTGTTGSTGTIQVSLS